MVSGFVVSIHPFAKFKFRRFTSREETPFQTGTRYYRSTFPFFFKCHITLTNEALYAVDFFISAKMEKIKSNIAHVY